MKYQNDNSNKLIFDNDFSNVIFSITNAYNNFKFCLLSLHIYSEGTVSPNFNLDLGFYLTSKEGNIFKKIQAETQFHSISMSITTSESLRTLFKVLNELSTFKKTMGKNVNFGSL